MYMCLSSGNDKKEITKREEVALPIGHMILFFCGNKCGITDTQILSTVELGIPNFVNPN